MELLTEQYVLMYNEADDWQLCFYDDGQGQQMVATTLEEAKKIRDREQENFDFPLRIVRESQTLVE